MPTYAPVMLFQACRRYALPVGLGLFLAAPVFALPTLESLLPQAGGEVVAQQPATAVERRYPLGALRKISGQLRMEGRVEAYGQARSLTYELPAGASAVATFTDARERLRNLDSQILFWCQGRDCGESSLWANEVFGAARLLGSDDQQAFLLVREDARTLLAVYTVTRGNRKVALHVERFEAAQPLGEVLPTPSTLLRELREAGRLQFPGLDQGPVAAWASVTARALNLDSALRVRVQGAQATAWLAALAAQGVQPARLEAGEPAGPLVLQWLR